MAKSNKTEHINQSGNFNNNKQPLTQDTHHTKERESKIDIVTEKSIFVNELQINTRTEREQHRNAKTCGVSHYVDFSSKRRRLNMGKEEK